MASLPSSASNLPRGGGLRVMREGGRQGCESKDRTVTCEGCFLHHQARTVRRRDRRTRLSGRASRLPRLMRPVNPNGLLLARLPAMPRGAGAVRPLPNPPAHLNSVVRRSHARISQASWTRRAATVSRDDADGGHAGPSAGLVSSYAVLLMARARHDQSRMAGARGQVPGRSRVIRCAGRHGARAMAHAGRAHAGTEASCATRTAERERNWSSRALVPWFAGWCDVSAGPEAVTCSPSVEPAVKEKARPCASPGERERADGGRIWCRAAGLPCNVQRLAHSGGAAAGWGPRGREGGGGCVQRHGKGTTDVKQALVFTHLHGCGPASEAPSVDATAANARLGAGLRRTQPAAYYLPY